MPENDPLFDPTDVCPHGKHRIVRCKQCERENQPLSVSPRRCSHGAEVHIGCTDPWPGISDRGEEAVRFIFDACHYFGASLVTAHRVCAVVAENIERMETADG